MTEKGTALAHEQLYLFDSIAEKYEEIFGDNAKQKESVAWLMRQLKKNSKVLDLGCGTANLTAKPLIDAGHEYLGIDSSEQMLKQAMENCSEANFIKADFSTFKFEKQYDAVMAYFSLLMLPKDKIASGIEKITAALSDGAYLIIAMVKGDFDYLEIPFLGKSAFLSAYHTEDFSTLLKSYSLELLKVEEYEHVKQEGEQGEVQQFFFCRKK